MILRAFLVFVLVVMSMRAATILVGDETITNGVVTQDNPNEGPSGELFAVTQAFTIVNVFDDIVTNFEFSTNNFDNTFDITVDLLTFVSIENMAYVALGTDLNLTGNTSSFGLESFSISSGGSIIYELDTTITPTDDQVIFNEVNDDPFTTATNDSVVFNNGSNDTDSVIFIPASIFGVLTSDVLTISYEYSGLPTNGNVANNDFVTVTDGTQFNIPVIPEPNTVSLLLTPSILVLLFSRTRVG